MPETKRLLKETFLSLGGPPNEKVIELQRSILTYMNIDPDFGVVQLGEIQSMFGADQEIVNKLQQYVVCAECAVK